MSANDYAEKLRDPRWQRRRLEIMQRDNFACTECGDTESTLNVHHRRYIRGVEPWDCPTAMLVTLCERCHEAIHEGCRTIAEALFDAMRTAGAGEQEFDVFGATFLSCLGTPDGHLTSAEWQAVCCSLEATIRGIVHIRNGDGDAAAFYALHRHKLSSSPDLVATR
ncbi:HNH endonuclease [Paraburkholderia sp. MM6662-R1]|uniref:HNH endonuclease n=1 Tax=Paraburkholderia sp. MM6662-R1 TaxID=2991066 RepID=UPI003D191DD1